MSMTSVDTIGSTFRMFLTGPKDTGERHGSNLTRIATLEARASKSVSLSILFFLPFMFFLFAFVMGEFLLVTTLYHTSIQVFVTQHDGVRYLMAITVQYDLISQPKLYNIM